MLEDWKKILTSDNLFRPSGIVLLNIAMLSILSVLNPLLKDVGLSVTARVYLYVGIWLLTIGIWLYNYLHLPRNKKGSIGIVVSLYCENKSQEVKLRNDFLRELKAKLANLEGVNCHFLCLPNHKAHILLQAQNPTNACIEWNKKIHGHYFLFGAVKQRGLDNKYHVDLAGFVTHAPVPANISSLISQDFNRILPNNVSFEETFELGGFTLTADLVSHSVKFIVGIAAMVSRDVFLAHKLHTALLVEIKGLPAGLSVRWKSRLEKFIADEENFIAIYYHVSGNIVESTKAVASLLSRYPHHYGGWLLKAIHDFNEGSIRNAIYSVKQAQQYAQRTHEWRYSLAFLLFWQGQHEEALKICCSIQKNNFPGEIITVKEVLSFVTDQIKRHPDRKDLYYWLGFVQYKRLGDLPNSLISFENFLALNNNQMKKMRQKAKAYLLEIKQQGGWL